MKNRSFGSLIFSHLLVLQSLFVGLSTATTLSSCRTTNKKAVRTESTAAQADPQNLESPVTGDTSISKGKPVVTAITVKRAVIDIGSGNTKLKIATVDLLKGSVVEEEKFKDKENEVKLGYQDAREFVDPKDEKKGYSIKEAFYRGEGAEALKKLVSLAHSRGVENASIRAIATAAIRDAKNSESIVKDLSESSGIKVIVLSQEAEGAYGARAGFSAATDLSGSKFTWDLGKGSFQIVGPENKDRDPSKYLQAGTTFASKAAMVSVNALLKKKNSKDLKSANPLYSKEAKKDEIVKGVKNLISQVADQIAKEKLNSDLQRAIKSAGKDLVVIGIGGVFSNSVGSYVVGDARKARKASKENYVAKEKVVEKVIELAQTTDDEFKEKGEKYFETVVSNMILVAAYMQVYEVPGYYAVGLSIADGALVSSNDSNLGW